MQSMLLRSSSIVVPATRARAGSASTSTSMLARALASKNTGASTRSYATAPSQQIGTDKPGSQGNKLSFRFGPRNVPIELWPMGFVIIAGLTGGTFAIYRHLTGDDLRYHENKHIEYTQHDGNQEGSDGKPYFKSATQYKGNGSI